MSSEPAWASAPEADDDASVGRADARACPFCGESVKRTAVLCRYCRSSLVTLPAEASRARGGGVLAVVALVLAIIGCPVTWWFTWIAGLVLFLAAVLVCHTAKANGDNGPVTGIAHAVGYVGIGVALMTGYVNLKAAGVL